MGHDIEAHCDGVGLVDHHCHGVLSHDLELSEMELLVTESEWPAGAGASHFDSPAGVAIRTLCGPLLDVPADVPATQYLARRRELGAAEVNRRLLSSTGIEHYYLETGTHQPGMLDAAGLAEVGGAQVSTLARLEVIAQGLLAETDSPREFSARLADALDTVARDQLGFKSVMAYRHPLGLGFDADRPGAAMVRASLDRLYAGPAAMRERLEDEVLLRHLLWEAVDRSRPIQIHVGYGDADIDLFRCDPTRMTEFVRRTRTSGAALMLLHCWPFMREAAFLAQIYPHVYLDTGAAVGFTGFASDQVVRESLEVAPFHKILFSSDAYALPELYVCGARLWRRAIGSFFGRLVSDGEMGSHDARRYIDLIAYENAARVYATGTA